MNKNLVNDTKATLVGIALGQALIGFVCRGMSKEKKIEMHIGSLIVSTMGGVANVAANEICRRIFDK